MIRRLLQLTCNLPTHLSLQPAVKDKGELVAEIITPPPTHPRRSVVATSTSVTNDSTSNDHTNNEPAQSSIASVNTSPGEIVMQEGRRLLQLSDSEDESDTFSY